MKTNSSLFGLILGISLVCASAANASSKFFDCSNDDGTVNVRLYKATGGLFKAIVKVESTGGATPSFTFKNVTGEALGAFNPEMLYTSSDSDFQLSVSGHHAPTGATVTVTSLNITNEDLTNCK